MLINPQPSAGSQQGCNAARTSDNGKAIALHKHACRANLVCSFSRRVRARLVQLLRIADATASVTHGEGACFARCTDFVEGQWRFCGRACAALAVARRGSGGAPPPRLLDLDSNCPSRLLPGGPRVPAKLHAVQPRSLPWLCQRGLPVCTALRCHCPLLMVAWPPAAACPLSPAVHPVLQGHFVPPAGVPGH